jgi:DNA-binding transcriptional regulator of glucitol operon
MKRMKKLRAALIILFVLCLGIAFYLGWLDNGPSLGFWPFLK